MAGLADRTLQECFLPTFNLQAPAKDTFGAAAQSEDVFVSEAPAEDMSGAVAQSEDLFVSEAPAEETLGTAALADVWCCSSM